MGNYCGLTTMVNDCGLTTVGNYCKLTTMVNYRGLGLMQQNKYQSCRNIPMAKYDHRNHSHRPAQLQQTCLEKTELHKAHVDQRSAIIIHG